MSELNLHPDQPLDWMIVLAAMLFPHEKDTEKRATWLAVAHAASYVELKDLGADEATLSRFHTALPGLWSANNTPQTLYRTGLERSSRGFATGGMLDFLIACDRHHPQFRKVKFAQAYAGRFLGQQTKPDGRQAEIGEDTGRKAWPEFRRAAHMWAALAEILGPDEFVVRHDDQMLIGELLSLAEGRRRIAEETGIVSVTEAWKPPPELKVKSCVLRIPRLRTEVLEWLETEFCVRPKVSTLQS